MITRAEAETIAAQYIAKMSEYCASDGYSVVLVADATIEYEFGWLFFYASSDPEKVPIAGNAPFIVERESGKLLETSTAGCIEKYIENYRTTGHPFGCLGNEIRLSGFNRGARSIDAIKALRNRLSIGLGDAKRIIENCLNGATIVVTAKTVDDAETLNRELNAALFIAERVPEYPGQTSH